MTNVIGGQETRELCIDLRSLRLCLIQSDKPSKEKKTIATIVARGITKIETVITDFGRGDEGELKATVASLIERPMFSGC